MSRTWGIALRRAYPHQVGRFRPSGIADCIRKQSAVAAGIEPADSQPLYIWQQELGRAGQDIALSAMKHLGLEIEHWLVEKQDVNGDTYLDRTTDVTVNGVLPGEADGKGRLKKGNLWRLPEGEILVEIKLRNTYAYGHVWRGDDLMQIDDGRVGMQSTMYMGQLGLKHALIGLFPFDSASVRNDKRFNKKDLELQEMSEYCRWFYVDFNPEIYRRGLERLAYGKEYGLKKPESIEPEFDPFTTNFPCNYCDVQSWCRRTINSRDLTLDTVPPVPRYGMPIREVILP